MKRLSNALFRENSISIAVFEFGVIGIVIVVAIILKKLLFGYFFWQDKMYDGIFLYWMYLGISYLEIFGNQWYKNRSFACMIIAGIMPATTILFLRWFFLGYISAFVLLVILAVYCMIIFFQMVLALIKKRKVKFISTGLDKMLSALCIASLLGTAGYCLSGMDTVDVGIAGSVVIAEDVRSWDENRDILQNWKKNVYRNLSDEDKQELFQAFINLECGYWGIEPIPLEVETYESETLMGYYVDQYYVISIREEMFDISREEVINTLLHEIHHAYVYKAVNSVDWDSEVVKANENLRVYADLKAYKEGIKHYVQSDEDFDSYYQNPIEVAAREYAEEWTGRYLEYIDNI